MTPAHISAVLQFITLTGAAFWLIVFFWPALREQLEFIRESSKRMDAQEIRMERVAVSIEKLAEVKEDVNWEDTRAKVDRVYGLADYWIKQAEQYLTAERKMRGVQGLTRLMDGLGRLERMVKNGS